MKRYPWLLAILLVNPKGTGQYPTIQSAIDAAVNGDEVHLASGPFTGPGNRDIDLLGKTIAVKGVGDILSEIWPHSDGLPHRAFIFRSGEGPDTWIENIGVIWAESDSLGAVLIQGSSPTFFKCLFEGNNCTPIVNMGGSPLFSYVGITGNQGGIRSTNGYLKIENSLIHQNNTERGGVVRMDGGYILDSELNGNSFDLTITPGGESCVYIVNTFFHSIQTLSGACVRILKGKPADDFAPLTLSPLSWAAIKVKYR